MRDQALKNAVLEANSKAGTMAETLGVKLIGVNTVTEADYQSYPLPRVDYASTAEAKAATELAPTAFKVQASAQITYLVGL